MSILTKSQIVLRQRIIYLQGLLGKRPKIPVRLDELEAAARKVLPKKHASFLDGSAGYEDVSHENNRAFKKWAIVQRVLTDINECKG